ncbi:MAG: recombinase family protein [archaeon]|nr:recombinase family protein [archaeon]
MEERCLSRRQAAKILDVHPITIWRWTKASKIRAITTPGGQYRYPLSEIKRIKGEFAGENGTRALIYARVSSQDQKQQGDLDRQLKRLRDYAFEHGLQVIEEITDIASGLNTERKGIGR